MSDMNGILCVYKEKNYTSFDVVAVMRRICGIKKIGHGGTLDPMATGVLPIFLGKATRAIDICADSTKAYRAEFKLGITTDTQDITGQVLNERDVNISKDQLKDIIDDFRGKISQIPPMYSAVKVNGKRLYDLARKGIEVERKPRFAEIFSLETLEFDGVCGKIEIHCSKGTYVRTIIHDIGEKLGCGAVMTGLERIKSSGFTLDEAKPLSFYKELSYVEIEKRLISVERVFEGFSKVFLDEKQSQMFKNGVRLDLNRIDFDFNNSNENDYSIYYEREFLGLACANIEEESLIIKKLF